MHYQYQRSFRMGRESMLEELLQHWQYVSVLESRSISIKPAMWNLRPTCVRYHTACRGLSQLSAADIRTDL